MVLRGRGSFVWLIRSPKENQGPNAHRLPSPFANKGERMSAQHLTEAIKKRNPVCLSKGILHCDERSSRSEMNGINKTKAVLGWNR